MLRVGKLTDLTKQQQQQQPAAAGGAGGGAPPGEVLPPVLQHLVNTLAHIDQERERKRQEQQQQLQQGAPFQCAFRALKHAVPFRCGVREDPPVRPQPVYTTPQIQEGLS